MLMALTREISAAFQRMRADAPAAGADRSRSRTHAARGVRVGAGRSGMHGSTAGLRAGHAGRGLRGRHRRRPRRRRGHLPAWRRVAPRRDAARGGGARAPRASGAARSRTLARSTAATCSSSAARCSSGSSARTNPAGIDQLASILVPRRLHRACSARARVPAPEVRGHGRRARHRADQSGVGPRRGIRGPVAAGHRPAGTVRRQRPRHRRGSSSTRRHFLGRASGWSAAASACSPSMSTSCRRRRAR